MPFYYPNWNNDFCRVMGLLFFGDKEQFAVPGQKRFDQARVEAFCREHGIALYDTACEVRRLKDNASDKFLEVVTPTDLPALLARIPECRTLVTTGQKATDVIVDTFACIVNRLSGPTSRLHSEKVRPRRQVPPAPCSSGACPPPRAPTRSPSNGKRLSTAGCGPRSKG